MVGTARQREIAQVPNELPQGTVTILFTDVEGATELTTSRGDTATQALLHAHKDLIRAQLAEHGGHEVDTAGDGFMTSVAGVRAPARGLVTDLPPCAWTSCMENDSGV